MQGKLSDLLEELDKAGKLSVGELEKRGFDRGFIDLVGKYYDLIRLQGSPAKQITDSLNIGDYLVVSPKGFEYLNPIKIKKAIEQLDASIKNFNDSSNKAYNQLNDSIKKFNESSDKSSEELIDLTKAIIVFTVIVAAIPLIEKINQLYNVNSPLSWIIGYFVMVIIIVAFMMYSLNKLYKKRV